MSGEDPAVLSDKMSGEAIKESSPQALSITAGAASSDDGCCVAEGEGDKEEENEQKRKEKKRKKGRRKEERKKERKKKEKKEEKKKDSTHF